MKVNNSIYFLNNYILFLIKLKLELHIYKAWLDIILKILLGSHNF